MSIRTASILIGVFCLGAVAFTWWIMGSSGIEFAVVGLVITVIAGSIGIIGPALGAKKKGGPTPK
jgi:Mg/Co/Ni transporter MgtE